MTNQELRIKIAQKLGYTVEGQKYNNSNEWFYYLLDPQGNPWIPNDGRMQAIVNGVKRTVREFDDPDTPWNTTPNWPESVDAALTLTIPDKEKIDGLALLKLIGSGSSWYATYYRGETLNYRRDYIGSGATPSLAICWAWLKYESED